MLLALFLLAFYRRKIFLIVFICSGQKFDMVVYSISDKLYRALKTVASQYFPPGMKVDPNMLLQQKSVVQNLAGNQSLLGNPEIHTGTDPVQQLH